MKTRPQTRPSVGKVLLDALIAEARRNPQTLVRLECLEVFVDPCGQIYTFLAGHDVFPSEAIGYLRMTASGRPQVGTLLQGAAKVITPQFPAAWWVN